MHKSNRHRNNINDTIENWECITYNNPLLNHIWHLLPGFVLWQLWKERNKIIFHSQASTPEATWERISSLIKETIRRKSWKAEDLNCNPEEHRILQCWQPILINQSTPRINKPIQISPITWSPPSAHFIKINFDGASKGNPGTTGYGAVIKDSKGEILGLIAGFLGEKTNNVAELTGLLRGLQETMNKDHYKLVLEGDSQVIIHLITKILNGSHPSKISPSW
jgi:hypothetical protein